MAKYYTTQKFKLLKCKDAGVYLIKGKITRSCRPLYIGSAERIKNRITAHFAALKANRHHNQPLQNYFNNYGEESFLVGVLEVCDAESTLIAEQKWLDKLKPFAKDRRGFNVAEIAESSQRGTKWSDAQREKILAVRSTKDYKQKITLARDKQKRVFKILSPSGKILEVRGLNKFCRENRLDVGSISKVLAGKNPSYKGWRLTPKPEHPKCSKSFTIVSPSGEVITATNITAFAKQHGINTASLRQVLYGDKYSFKGWKKHLTRT